MSVFGVDEFLLERSVNRFVHSKTMLFKLSNHIIIWNSSSDVLMNETTSTIDIRWPFRQRTTSRDFRQQLIKTFEKLNQINSSEKFFNLTFEHFETYIVHRLTIVAWYMLKDQEQRSNAKWKISSFRRSRENQRFFLLKSTMQWFYSHCAQLVDINEKLGHKNIRLMCVLNHKNINNIEWYYMVMFYYVNSIKIIINHLPRLRLRIFCSFISSIVFEWNVNSPTLEMILDNDHKFNDIMTTYVCWLMLTSERISIFMICTTTSDFHFSSLACMNDNSREFYKSGN